MHSDEIARLCCSSQVREGVARYAAKLAAALDRELAGIYLYGSLAHGCFHPETSDVDVVVVTEGPCSEAAISEILRVHEEARIPLDATFATRSQVGVDETPTPVDFVVKPVGDQRLVRSREGLRDFLLQRQDVYECNVALAGRPARDVVRPVPWEALARCLDDLFPHIVPRFKNPTLMLCRIVYAFANGKLWSKQAGGEWALGTMEEEWRPLVEEALVKYGAGVPDDRGPNESLRAFEKYCARYMAEVRGIDASMGCMGDGQG